jgi:cell fate (sporulation/competence/biofilm development) regulator YlbF (YheA/YmcA/DUF963 family)
MKATLKSPPSIEQLIGKLKTEVMEAAEKPVMNSLEEFKAVLLSRIESMQPEVDKNLNLNRQVDEQLPVFPKASEETIKALLKVDVSKIRMTDDYTDAHEGKVCLINNYRVRLRLPMSDSETFEESHSKATSFFNNCLFAIKDRGGKVRYIYNPGIDLSRFVKVVCSPFAGDTERSRKVFDSYKNSPNRPTQGDSESGRFSSWSLKQEGLKHVLGAKGGLIDVTSIVDDIQSGNEDSALEKLKGVRSSPVSKDLENKIKELKTSDSVSKDFTAYKDTKKLIKSLKVKKVVKDTKVEFRLEGNEPATADFNPVYEELRAKISDMISMWNLTNEQDWLNVIMKAIDKVIKDIMRQEQ